MNIQSVLLFLLTFIDVLDLYLRFIAVPDTDYDANAQKELVEALKYRWNTNKAKNVILFLGDGMGRIS